MDGEARELESESLHPRSNSRKAPRFREEIPPASDHSSNVGVSGSGEHLPREASRLLRGRREDQGFGHGEGERGAAQEASRRSGGAARTDRLPRRRPLLRRRLHVRPRSGSRLPARLESRALQWPNGARPLLPARQEKAQLQARHRQALLRLEQVQDSLEDRLLPRLQKPPPTILNSWGRRSTGVKLGVINGGSGSRPPLSRSGSCGAA